MDPNSTNIFEIWKDFGKLTINGNKELHNTIQEQTLKLDVFYNNLLQSVIPKEVNYEPEKKMSKRQSKVQNGPIGDLFAAEPSFQQPALPPVRRTRRQASMLAVEKIKGGKESTAISCMPSTRNHSVIDLTAINCGPSTRASRARTLSTLINSPIANSTFVVDKKLMANIDQCASPQMFPSENEITYIKPAKPNTTYNKLPKSSTANTTKKNNNKICLIPEESPMNIENNCLNQQSSTKLDLKTKSEESQIKNKRREKLEDIDVNNIEEPPTHLTRTMKRKLQEENPNGAKKSNVKHVPLEQIVSTPLKTLDCLSQTPHQIRENEAEKRKEIFLKSKADQRKFDKQQIKVAKHKEEHLKLHQEKIKKKEEESKKRDEKLKEKELMMKKEALKKQKQTELRLAEINAKRLQAQEARLLKLQQIEMNQRKLKEDEMKKKTELKPVKSKSVHPKVVNSNLPVPSIPKGATLPKSKVEKTGININDYGLNDVSARDSSEDESGPKKPVPTWAKKENRKSVLELQSNVDLEERDLFFDCPKSMSLKEMFKGWKIRDKQRTSSAVWNTPLRYSEYIRTYN